MKIEFDCQAFFSALDWTKEEVRRGAEKGMEDATNDLLEKSRNLAPLDKSTLRKTAGRDIKVTHTGVKGEVYFHVPEEVSGKDVDYALITHELGESYKDPTTLGTQPKYLERPLKENAEEYKQMIADAIREELG